MDFTPSEERRMLQDTLTRFLENEYSLAARDTAAQTELGFDESVWAGLAELGVFAALFSEEKGGFGGSGFDTNVVFQAMGRALVSAPLIDSIVLAGGAVAASGQAQHVEYLGKIIDGSARAAFAHYESPGRYDPHFVQSTAICRGDNWVLNGQKSLVRFCFGADHLVLSARVSGGENEAGGLALFLLPRDAAGMDITSFKTLDGASAAHVTLTEVPANTTDLLCPVADTTAVLETVIGQATLATCAEALGIIHSIKNLTLEYLRTRQQFGVVIGRFQALQHRMAEMLLEIEGAKSAVINAAAAMGGPRAERERTLSATKYTLGRVGTLVAEDSIQMHGGIGMTWEYDLGHFTKRLILIDHEFGDEDYHLQRFIEFGR